MEKFKNLLYQSFDRKLTPAEQKILDDALIRSNELKNEKLEIEKMRNMLEDYRPLISNDFTAKVMNKIENRKTFYTVFKYLVMTGVAAIILLLVTIYFTDGTVSYETLSGLSGYTPETDLLSMFN
jgi:uncharacterized membrane protein